MNKADWVYFWYLFHEAWGEAKESPIYDKKTWNEMQFILEQLEMGKDYSIPINTNVQFNKEKNR